jgi:RNA polymerase sigma factor (sigma-70 family)
VDSADSDALPPTAGAITFATTQWSLILSAANLSSQEAETALGKLYSIYAFPLYSYIRRYGISPESAQDMVQEVFLCLLEKNQLASVSPEKGRFRSYLLAVAKHRLANEWRRSQRQRHGGGQTRLELDALAAEERYRLEPADHLTPDLIFERQWALALLESVYSRLRAEAVARNKEHLLDAFRAFLSGDSEVPSFAAAGQSVGLSEGAARVAVHRLRQRYRDLLRAEVLQTLADPSEVDAELRHLVSVLRR